MDNGQLKMENDEAIQAVPKGYKQTEVGVIPEDWDVQSIGSSMKLLNGRAFRPDEWGEIGLPIIRIQNLNGAEAAFNYFSGSVEDRHRVDAGDLLFAWSGTKGTSFGARIWFGQTGVLNQHIFKVLPDKKRLSQKYAFLVLRKAQDDIEKQAHGFKASFVHVKKSDLVGVLLPVAPSTAEQEAIAEALSDADALIESLEQLLTKKRQIKQGAMQDLLTGKHRLPGFNGEWDIKQLGDVVEKFVGGGTPSRSNPGYWGGKIPWVTVKDFATFTPFQSQESITKAGLHGSASHLIPKGTLITSTRMALGKAVIYAVDVAINQDLKALFPKQCLSALFLYFWFEHHGESIYELGSGSTVKGISLLDLRKIEFRQPPLLEQTAIATLLSDMDAEIAQLESRLTKARQIKQGMMQELLTGRIRLVRPESNVVSLPDRAQSKAADGAAHNRQIEEAAMLGVLSALCGTEHYPLARVRRTKLIYLFQRHLGQQTDVYLKKAAGPYNPATRYKGPEGIAVKNGYVRVHHNGTYEGFVGGEKVSQSRAYLEKWHGAGALSWLEKIRFKKTDELELLATVDMAMQDLVTANKSVTMLMVKQVIEGHPEWEAKLERETFSDDNLERAIQECKELFS